MVQDQKSLASEGRRCSPGRKMRPRGTSTLESASFVDVEKEALRARHNDFERRQAEQERALDDLRRRVVELEGRTASVAESTLEGATHAEGGMAFEQGHQLCQTVWDAILLVGLPDAGPFGSLSIVAGFFVNLAVQSLLCLVVFHNFITVEFPTLDEVRRWRFSTAHDVMWADSITGSSLASRVCGGDDSLIVSSRQKGLVAEISNYTGNLKTLDAFFDLPQGALLCGLAIFIWYLIVMSEFQDAVHFMFGVVESWRRNRKTGARESRVHQDTHGGKTMEVGSFRLIAMGAVIVVRVVLCNVLFFVGLDWLLSTTSVTDIILNAASLSFILDVDEHVFATMVNRRAKSLLSKLQPLPRLVTCRCQMRCVPLTFPITVWLSLVAMLVFLVTRLRANVDNMSDLSYYLCEGNLDFVAVTIEPGGIVMVSESDAYSNTFAADFGIMAMREAVWSDDLSNVNFSIPTPSTFWFDTFSTIGMAEYGELQVGCRDFVNPNPFTRSLAFRLNLSDTWTCPDAKQNCSASDQNLLRLMCPWTCGCGHPQSGLYVQRALLGCPMTICRSSTEYKVASSEISCTTPSAEELQGNSNWTALLENIKTFSDDVGAELATIATFLSEYGCAALEMGFRPILCRSNPFWASFSMWCPVECGCRAPPSSNTEAFFEEPCPAQCDSWRTRFQKSLETVACADGTASDFGSNTTAAAFLNLHYEVYGTFSSNEHLPHVGLQLHGCEGVNLTWCGLPWMMRALCPIRCGCLDMPNQVGCPSSCVSSDVASDIPEIT